MNATQVLVSVITRQLYSPLRSASLPGLDLAAADEDDDGGGYIKPSSLASFSSCACCRLRATWAAITLCLSAISVHFAQAQSLQRQ